MSTIAAPSIIRISTWGFSTDDCAHELRLTRRSDIAVFLHGSKKEDMEDFNGLFDGTLVNITVIY